MQLWVCGSRVLSPVASLLVFLYHMPARCFKCAAHKHIHTYTIHTYICTYLYRLMLYHTTVLVGLHLRLALSGFFLPNVSQCFNVLCAVCASFSLLFVIVVVLLPPLFLLPLLPHSPFVLLAFVWLVPNLSFLAEAGELEI